MDYLSKDYNDLIGTATKYKEQYSSATPFPNIYFDDFFDADFLNELLEEFPDLSKKNHIHFNNPNEIKLASRGELLFGPKTKQFVHFLNSEPFINFLQELTGIKERLLPDPFFEGGGYHEIKPGGLLKIHADFNKHRQAGLDRRLNVLIYLNKDWEEDYGGHFELWTEDMKTCVQKILPKFNRMALFSTTDFSYHGHPEPLNCPPDRSRKSLALYYYSNGRPVEEINSGLENHRTLFVPREGVAAEKKMKRFNTVVNVVTAITPPIILSGIKKIFLKTH